MLKINGVDMPTPSSFTVDIYDITEGGRDSTGTMHLDLVATKYKVKAQWKLLTQEQISDILRATSSLSFSATFTDPDTNSDKTITAYKGDRSLPVKWVSKGITYYENFTLSLVEM